MNHEEATEDLVVVINENTLGHMPSRNIDWFSTAGVIEGRLRKGGANWKNGIISVTPTDRVRPATLEDFEAFGVSPRGYRLQSTE